MSDFVLSCSVTRSKCAGRFPCTSYSSQENRRNILNRRLSRRFLDKSSSDDRICELSRQQCRDCCSRDIGDGGVPCNTYNTVTRSSSCRLELSSCTVRKSEVDRLRDEVRRRVKPRSRSMKIIGNESWQARLDGLGDGGFGSGGGGDGDDRPLRHIWSYYKSIWSSSSDSDSDYEDAVGGSLYSDDKEHAIGRLGNPNGDLVYSEKPSNLSAYVGNDNNKSISEKTQPLPLPKSESVGESVEDIIYSVEEMTRSTLNSIEKYDSGCISAFAISENNSKTSNTKSIDSNSIDSSSSRTKSFRGSSCQIKPLDNAKDSISDHDKTCDNNNTVDCSVNLKLKDTLKNSLNGESLGSDKTSHNGNYSFSFSGESMPEQERVAFCKPRLNSFGEDGISSDFGSSMEFLDSSNSDMGCFIDVEGRLGNKKLISDDSDLGSSKDDLNSDSDSDALSEDFLTAKCIACDENAADQVDFSLLKCTDIHKSKESGKCRLCVDFSTDDGTFSISSDTYSPPLHIAMIAPFCANQTSCPVLSSYKNGATDSHQNKLSLERDSLGVAKGDDNQQNEKFCIDNQSLRGSSLSSTSGEESTCEQQSVMYLSDSPKDDDLISMEASDSLSDTTTSVVASQFPSTEVFDDVTSYPTLPMLPSDPSYIGVSKPVCTLLHPKDARVDDNLSLHSNNSNRLSNISTYSGSPRLGSTRRAEAGMKDKMRLIDLIEFSHRSRSSTESTRYSLDQELYIDESVIPLSPEENEMSTEAGTSHDVPEIEKRNNEKEIETVEQTCYKGEVTMRNKKRKKDECKNLFFSSVADLDTPLTSLESRFPSFFVSAPSIHYPCRESTSTIATSTSLPAVSSTDLIQKPSDTPTTPSTTDSAPASGDGIRTSSSLRVKRSSGSNLTKHYSSCLKTVTSALRKLPSPSQILQRSSSIFNSHRCSYDLQLASMAYFSSCPSTPVTGKRRLTATPSLLTFTSSTNPSQSLPQSPSTPFDNTPPSTPSSLRLPLTSSPLSQSVCSSSATTPISSSSKSQRQLHGLDENSIDPITNSPSLSSLLSSTPSITNTNIGLPPLHSSSPKSSISSLSQTTTSAISSTKKPSFWPSRPNTSKSRKLRYRSLSLDSRIPTHCQCKETDSPLGWDQEDSTALCLSTFDCSTDPLRVHRPFLLPLFDAKKVERNRLSSPVDSAPREEKKAQQFGLSLLEIKENTGHIIPKPVEDTIEYLKTVQGDEVQGLFRRCARVTTMREVQEKYDDGETVDFSQYGDPHLAGAILKKFLRELSEPLMTFDLFEPITRLHYLDPGKQVLEVQRILKDELPDDNYIILKYIYQFLQQVVAKNEINLMTSANMATVFGPNIAWPKGQANLSNVEQAVKFSLILLDSFDDVFLR